MNVYDSEQMAQAMSPAGYDLTSDPAEADLMPRNLISKSGWLAVWRKPKVRS